MFFIFAVVAFVIWAYRNRQFIYDWFSLWFY